MWVIQEILLSPSNTCVCGKWEFTFSDLLVAAMWIVHNAQGFGSELTNLIYRGVVAACATYTGHIEEERDRLWLTANLLASTRQLHATDPRDKVFGLLGIFRRRLWPTRDIPPTLQPDYNKSLAQVLRGATVYMMDHVEDLSTLIDVIHRSHEDLLYPAGSWVRRLDRPWDNRGDPYPLFNANHLDAGRGQDVKPWRSETFLANAEAEGVLSLQGFVLDVITAQSQMFAPDSAEAPSPEKILCFVDSVVAMHSRSTGRLPDRATLAYVLIGGTTAENEEATAQDLEDVHNMLKRLRVDAVGGNTSMTGVDAAASAEPLVENRTLKALRFACFQHRVFVTQRGYLGLGPKISQPGDIVAIVYGCRLLFVLRPRDDGDYYVVGPAVVHGVMQGEVVRQRQAEAWEEQVFRIH